MFTNSTQEKVPKQSKEKGLPLEIKVMEDNNDEVIESTLQRGQELLMELKRIKDLHLCVECSQSGLMSGEKERYVQNRVDDILSQVRESEENKTTTPKSHLIKPKKSKSSEKLNAKPQLLKVIIQFVNVVWMIMVNICTLQTFNLNSNTV
jgi:hypothetical protein